MSNAIYKVELKIQNSKSEVGAYKKETGSRSAKLGDTVEVRTVNEFKPMKVG